MACDKKCDNCGTIKTGILSPSIMVSKKPISQDECNLNCLNDKKPNILITRSLLAVGLIVGAIAVGYFVRG